jgi:hypothetical protein
MVAGLVNRTAVERDLIETIAVERQEAVQAPAAEGEPARAVLQLKTCSVAEEKKARAALRVHVEPPEQIRPVESRALQSKQTGDATSGHLSTSSGSAERSFSTGDLRETVE